MTRGGRAGFKRQGVGQDECYDIEKCIGFILNRSFRAFQKRFDEQLARHGLTCAQFYVLAKLLQEGDNELTQSELAGRVAIESPTLVPILDRMEAAGLTERRRNPEDRRSYLVHLLPRGLEMAPVIKEIGETVNQKATAGLSADAVHTLRESLLLLRKNLGE